MNGNSGGDGVARKIAMAGTAGIVAILGGAVIAITARSIDPPFPLARTFSTGSGMYSSRYEVSAGGEDFFGRFTGVEVEEASAHFAHTAIIAACAALAALVVAWFLGRGKRDSRHSIGGPALLLIFAPLGYLLVDFMSHHLPGVHRYIRHEYPYYAQWTLTVAAYGLVAAGILLVATLAVLPGSLRSLSRRGLALSLVTGFLIVGLTGAAAAWSGDDGTNIEHRTAETAEPAPIPATLGTQRYAVTTAALTADGRPDDLVIAGTGFVIASESGLTAYDGATGEQRWHYRRTDVGSEHPLTYSPGSLRSLDGGTVVAAKWEWWGWKVFDAVTGELVRNAAGPESVGGEPMNYLPFGTKYRPGMAISEQDGALTRHDARTGELLWSSERLLPGCVRGPDSAASTDRTIVVVAGCAGEGDTVRVVALDPQTGAVTATRDVARGIESVHARAASVHPVDNHLVVEWSGDRRGRLVIGASGDLAGATELDGGSGRPIATDPHGTEVFDGVDVLDTASGAVAATYPPANTTARVNEFGRQVEPTAAFLASEVVEFHRQGRELTLRILPRAHTAPVTGQPFTAAGHCESSVLLPAPGAVLVFCPQAADQETGLFGFAP